MRVNIRDLKSKDIDSVMQHLLDNEVASYDPLTGEQKVFLACAQFLNDELRIRQPSRNGSLFKRLADATGTWTLSQETARRLARERAVRRKARRERAALFTSAGEKKT